MLFRSIMEVLTPYLERHKGEFKGEEEEDALKDYLAMAKTIAKLKAKRYTPDEVVAMVKKWKDDGDFDANIQKLRDALEELDKG